MALKPEQIDHINYVNWFEYNFPELHEDFHHFANERRCSIQEGRTLKRMGVKKGVFDFHLAIPSRTKHGLWLELKVGKGRPTKDQLAFHARKIKRGYEAKFVIGIEEAKKAALEYLDDCIIEKSSS